MTTNPAIKLTMMTNTNPHIVVLIREGITNAGVKNANNAQQIRERPLIKPWTEERTSIGNDSCVQTLYNASPASGVPKL